MYIVTGTVYDVSMETNHPAKKHDPMMWFVNFTTALAASCIVGSIASLVVR